jgi:CheY-like chemotaxis protein
MRARRALGSDLALNVLLVDDNPADRLLTTVAFEEADLSVCLAVVEDGFEALAYLGRDPPYLDASRPDVVLLDVNMPGLSGLEVVRQLRVEPDTAELFVLLLVGSALDVERFERHELQVDGYLRKPVDVTAMLSALAESRTHG